MRFAPALAFLLLSACQRTGPAAGQRWADADGDVREVICVGTWAECRGVSLTESERRIRRDSLEMSETTGVDFDPAAQAERIAVTGLDGDAPVVVVMADGFGAWDAVPVQDWEFARDWTRYD